MPSFHGARRGDRDAAGRLLTAWEAELAQFVRHRAGPELLAKESRADIVQSACREVLAAMPGAEIADGAEGFKAWLFRATLHKIIDRHRYWGRGKRDRAREVERAWSDASVDALAGSFATPSSVAEREELAERNTRACWRPYPRTTRPCCASATSSSSRAVRSRSAWGEARRRHARSSRARGAPDETRAPGARSGG